MGTSLNGLTPAGTYPGLIKTGDNAPIDGTLKTLSDGNGNNLPMAVSTTAVNFTGTLTQGGTTLQPTLVSGTNIKTINGASLLGSGDIPVVTSPSGVAGAIQFSNGSAFASDAANLFWDDTNNRLGVGTNAPDTTAHFKGGVSGAVGTRIATFEGSLPEILFKDTSNNTGFAIAKYGQIVYFVNTNSSGAYSSYSGLTNSQGKWSFGGGFNPSGTVHIKGSGSTSATTSLLVQNSSGTELLKVADNGEITTYDINARVIYARANTLELRPNASGGAGSASLQGFVSGLGWLSMFTAESGKDFGQIPRGAVVNGTTINASAIFQVDSTTKGFLPPRMTTTQKNAIASPAAGLVVYDSTTNKLCCYNGSTWNDLF